MRRYLVIWLALAISAVGAWAQSTSFSEKGNLDCNGFSAIQKPIKTSYLPCADFQNPGGGRGYDNGWYIGHDEPSIGFFSNAPGSATRMQYEVTLPVEKPLPATQSFENFITFWFSLVLCDPDSFPNGPCIPDSDANSATAGAAALEVQLYPPGFPPFVTQVSCDLQHWCAALTIDSLEVTSTNQLNPNCTEPVNFAFLQLNGVPTGPPGPANATEATFTPNGETFLMNQGDRLRITIADTRDGLLARIDDLTTGQHGFMVASAQNGFQHLDHDTCAPTNFSFHPEFSSAKFGNFVPWAALQANVNVAYEIGHFVPGANGDNDADDAPCFPGPTLAGCLGSDTDFDGTSYLHDWPGRFMHNWSGGPDKRTATAAIISPPTGPHGSYPQIQFLTEVGASESTCTSSGAGCVVPPVGAQFYPYYALDRDWGGCNFVFGDFRHLPNFGQDAQYGSPNLAWFFATTTSGVLPNPCRRGDDH